VRSRPNALDELTVDTTSLEQEWLLKISTQKKGNELDLELQKGGTSATVWVHVSQGVNTVRRDSGDFPGVPRNEGAALETSADQRPKEMENLAASSSAGRGRKLNPNWGKDLHWETGILREKGESTLLLE